MGLGESKPETSTIYPQSAKFQNNRGPRKNGKNQQVRHDRPRATELAQGKPKSNNVKPHKPYAQQSPPQQEPKVLMERTNKGQKNGKRAECNVCGHEGHTGDRCYHRHQTCQICLQPGHLRSVCKQTIHHPDSTYKPKGGGNKLPRANH